MLGSRLFAVVALAGVLSGCAGGRTRQDVARLQSQLGLLDERVTQLERSSTSGSSAGVWNETAASSALATGINASGLSSKALGASAQAPSKSSHKYSTRDIQQALKNAGFYQGSVDGKMGAQTKEAIKEFQRVHGLKDDGVVGKQTWAKLSAYTAPSSASPSTTEVSLK